AAEPATASPLPATASAAPPTAQPSPAPARTTRLVNPDDVAFDANGNMYISECNGAPAVLKFDTLGQVTPYAGIHIGGFSGDGGPATDAELSCTEGIAFDRDGNLFVADLWNNRIRKIDRDGLITTVAGTDPITGTPPASAGDGGPAMQAQLQLPTDV